MAMTETAAVIGTPSTSRRSGEPTKWPLQGDGMRWVGPAGRAAAARSMALALWWVPSLGTLDLLGDLGAFLEGELGGEREGPARFLAGGGGLSAFPSVAMDGADEALHPAGEACALGCVVAAVDGLGDLTQPVRRPGVHS
ncbi:hypothetical protein [Streptomyces roseochromogenus]|uniref:hypothetical protein n=1 Tax=Streptomyces roseochromogenus TaxID=285450 RepID=UPI001319BAFC|nr:hypothetical protein [Streptomyces roseochromogenus]